MGLSPLLLPLLLAPALQDPASGEPPARALSRRLTGIERLAGTSGSERGARFVAGVLEEAGWTVELDRRRVLLSYPRRIELVVHDRGEVVHRWLRTFDPDRVPPGDVPLYNAFSGSGRVRARVVDVGRGLREDYERLAGEGIDVQGCVALARYGGSYRGVKAELAEEHGCAAVLLFTESDEDGAGRGPTWPAGPWKPAHEAQRGSIAPLAVSPGDPSTPGWASPAVEGDAPRLGEAERDALLPRIPCTPIGWNAAGKILAALAAERPVEVQLELDVPRVVRPIVNVVAKLRGKAPRWVLAGNHRDAWVRGAHDAGSGTVSLLRAAQHLGARRDAGWEPANTIVLGFWDAEEFGLMGSTEWGEAHAEELEREGLVYVNSDAVVSGLRPHVSGTPGLLQVVREALRRVPDPSGSFADLEAAWLTDFGEDEPRLALPGSGSDYTVFLHHLGLPVLDVSFSGNGGGQYHTAFDDFLQMDRHLDPTWEGHETAGRFLAELLALLAERGGSSFDAAEAARDLARHARDAGPEGERPVEGLGAERAERLAQAFERIAGASTTDRRLYRMLASELPDRPWYRNVLWAPGRETGYAAVTWPTLRAAAPEGEEALARAFLELVQPLEALARSWTRDGLADPPAGSATTGGER